MTDDKPEWAIWDADKAADLVGRVVIVGITRVRPDGELIEQFQIHGVVAIADQRRGIGIEVHGEKHKNETYWLPPSPNVFERARPGTYKLSSTGESVTDPEYFASMTSTVRADS